MINRYLLLSSYGSTEPLHLFANKEYCMYVRRYVLYYIAVRYKHVVQEGFVKINNRLGIYLIYLTILNEHID